MVLPRSTSFVTTAPTTAYSCTPFDLIQLNSDDLRRDPLEGRKATLEMMLAKAGPGIRFNEHIEGEERLCFGTPASLASKALSRNGRAHLTAPAARPIGSK
jgi:ATP-dependent DNA ligase